MDNLKKLSDNHKAFVRKYIECGNRTSAYLAVYKNVKDTQLAAVKAYHLLEDPLIKEYYNEISEAVTADDVADIHEVLTTLTKVMRREICDMGKDGEPIPPKVAEVIRAGEMILKHIEPGTESDQGAEQSGVILMPEVKEEKGEQ